LAAGEFAKIERDVIARGIFTSVADLKRKLMRYIRQYNRAQTREVGLWQSGPPHHYRFARYSPLRARLHTFALQGDGQARM
jgi:hypothetical protein